MAKLSYQRKPCNHFYETTSGPVRCPFGALRGKNHCRKHRPPVKGAGIAILNARLIAAAPDLLESMKSALVAISYYHEHEGATDMLWSAKDAIKKAEGRK